MCVKCALTDHVFDVTVTVTAHTVTVTAHTVTAHIVTVTAHTVTVTAHTVTVTAHTVTHCQLSACARYMFEGGTSFGYMNGAYRL